MTQHLIYGKDITIQGDSVSIQAPTTLTGNPLTFPIPSQGLKAGQNALITSGFLGAAQISNPAVVGPPASVPANSLNFFVQFGVSQPTAPTTLMICTLATTNAVPLVTCTAGTPSILIPGWLPLGYRPANTLRIPVAGQVGPVAQPTTLVFQLETNGDVRIFKDTINTAWLNTDTFSITSLCPFSYLAVI